MPAELHHVAPPTPVTGQPSVIREAVVQTVNSDGTVDLRAIDSRAGWTQMTVPGWYVPTAGDSVYVAHLQGDPQQAAVIAPVTGNLGKPPYVTTLTPGQQGIPNPVPDSFEVYYAADATNGVIWHLRYRKTSASTYKWEFVGGSSLFSANVLAVDVTNTTYVDPGGGIAVALPLAGDYEVTVGVGGWSTGAGTTNFGSYAIGATAASDNDAAFFSEAVASTDDRRQNFWTQRKTGLSAVTLAFRARTTGGTFKLRSGLIEAKPIRVG